VTPVASFASVLLDTPLPQLDHLFEYRIPESLLEQVAVGSKVSVPLRGGTRFSDAFVTSISDKAEFAGELLSIEKVISTIPVLLPETLELARTIADRQAGSAIDVIRLVIPPRYVRVEKTFQPPQNTALSALTIPVPEEFGSFSCTEGARYAIKVPPRLLDSAEGSVPNWIELFVSLAQQQLVQGNSTIICVPDFRIIDQIYSRLESVGLQTRTIRVDSKLTGQERYFSYLRSLQDDPIIVLGNRSANLSPAPALGLILMWDDGDHNFEEPLSPYAHARDVALIRQAQTHCSLVFASHTRSLETQRLVEIGWLDEVPTHPVVKTQIVLTDATVEEGISPSRIPSAAILAAKRALEFGPVLVQVASPGFAPAVVCSDCSERALCQRCNGPLGIPHRNSAASCRWCGQLNTRWHCLKCDGEKLRPIAAGTERTSEEIGRAFPGTKIVVADGQHVITTIGPEPAIVISTPGAEPFAKNGYSAILLLDGERLRGRESLRVDEDVLRNWSNTIALAQAEAPILINGAGQRLGETLINSAHISWAAQELSDRYVLQLPPAVRVVSVTGPLETVKATCENIPDSLAKKILGPISTHAEAARSLVFFDYKSGEPLAVHLRAEIISSATRSKKPTGGSGPGRVLRLRVRFDDPEIDSL
jgi:primosomal protein N' (replication factor Y)